MKSKPFLLSALAFLFAMPAAAAPEDHRSIVNVLKTRRITVKFEKASLDTFVKYVRAASGLDIVVLKARIERDGGDADAIEITIDAKDVTVGQALALALEGQEIGFKVTGKVLVLTSRKDALGKPVLRIYSVAHLLVQIRDFPARDMNIYPSNYEPPEPPEVEVRQTYDSSDELAELVRRFTGKDTWENEGVAVHVFRKHLFIRQYPHVHAEIARFLAELPH